MPKTKKSSTTKKKSTTKSPRFSLGIESEVAKGVWSILFFALAIVLILVIIGQAGNTGETIKDALQDVAVGEVGLIALPFVLLCASIALIIFWKTKSAKSVVIAMLIFFSSFLGVVASTASFDQEVVETRTTTIRGADITEENQEQTTQIPAVVRGGYWGYGIAYPLVAGLGSLASIVILVAIASISLIVAFNVSLGNVIHSVLYKQKPEDEEGEEVDQETQGDKGKESEEKEKKSLSQQPEKPSKPEEPKEEQLVGVPSFTSNESTAFQLPPFDLLELDSKKPTSGDIQANAIQIKQTLQTFGIEVDIGEVSVGPTVTQYTMRPREGTKVAKITTLSNDLALALAAEALRIEAPIPGKSLVGIEVPNKVKAIVRLRNLIEREEFQKAGKLPIALGRNVSGKAMYADLSTMPHLLIAGSTGSGKTIALTSVIISLLYKNTPEQLRLLLIDPKRVEFNVYAGIPHLLAPVVTDNSKAINALKWAVSEMERRFDVLSRVGARDIIAYHNNKEAVEQEGPLPYLVIIIDEMADLMAAKGKEVEILVVRIAQLARAAGIHLILATQRPSTNVITGIIKANLPTRMAFQVASQIDSRTILDMAGAEKLIGKGDMLFLGRADSKPVRIQGTFIQDNEVKKVADYLREQQGTPTREQEVENFDTPQPTTPDIPPPQHASVDFDNVDASAEDDKYEEAKQVVVKTRKASTSLLQRRLGVGYARAARLIDLLEENGVIGPANGSKPRDVYVEDQEQQGEI